MCLQICEWRALMGFLSGDVVYPVLCEILKGCTSFGN